MEKLKEKIRKYGTVLPGGIIRADSFLNHQVDIELAGGIADEFYARFAFASPTVILTIESSGIAFAAFTAQRFSVPLVFAKKQVSSNLADDQCYMSHVVSFTKHKEYDVVVNKKYLKETDRVLIVDDFLAMGSAVNALAEIVSGAGAYLCGVGIVIEKNFQPGGARLREAGVRVESLAIVDSADGEITFVE